MSGQSMEPIRVYINGKPLDGVRSFTLTGFNVTVSERNINGNNRETAKDRHNPGAAGHPRGCTCRTCTFQGAFERAAGAARTASAGVVAAAGLGVAIDRALEHAKQVQRQEREQREQIKRLMTSVPAATFAAWDELPTWPGLPVEHQELSMLGRRALRVAIHSDNQLQLYSQVRNRLLKVLDRAACSSDHEVPELHCGCGFWAVKPGTGEQYPGVHATVELSGRIIEGEVGYRARWQRILELHLPMCAICKNDKVAKVTRFPNRSEALCPPCLKRYWRDTTKGHSVHRLASRSPVPVYYANGDRIDV